MGLERLPVDVQGDGNGSRALGFKVALSLGLVSGGYQAGRAGASADALHEAAAGEWFFEFGVLGCQGTLFLSGQTVRIHPSYIILIRISSDLGDWKQGEDENRGLRN
jgi:hypothetical protein